MSHRSHPPSNLVANVQRPASPSTTSWQNSSGRASPRSGTPLRPPEDFADSDDDDEDNNSAMGKDRRPAYNRPGEGRSHLPLLHKDDEERGRSYDSPATSPNRPPLFTRRSTMRSRSPDTQAKLATKKKYTYAAFFLGLSLISFVIQTETAVYIQHELKWNKAYCML